MTIALVTDYFFPSSIGGTEKYVFLLAKHLQIAGHTVKILTLSSTKKKEIYLGLDIDYISPNTNLSSLVVKGIKSPNNISEFQNYLNSTSPDIVHFHTYTTNFNHFHFELASKNGYKTFFTSHIPGHICPRGDFRFLNTSNCNGKLSKMKCAACYSNFKAKSFLSSIGLFTYNYLSPTSITNLRPKILQKISSSVHRFIAVSDWQLEFLKKNGIKNNLAICKQGVEITSKTLLKSNSSSPLYIGYLGRIDPEKGIHLLIEAASMLPQNLFSFVIATPKPTHEHASYFEKLMETVSKLPNVKWRTDVTDVNIDSFFNSIDFLTVPSLCFETGPFVVNEAFAHYTPVIGSNLGGIKELIIENVNGHLFTPNVNSLVSVISNLKRENYQHYKLTVRQPIEMFNEMQSLYEN